MNADCIGNAYFVKVFEQNWKVCSEGWHFFGLKMTMPLIEHQFWWYKVIIYNMWLTIVGTSVVVVFLLEPFCSTNNFPKLYFLYRNVLLLRLKNAVTWEGIGVAFLMFIKEKSPKQGQYHEKAYPIASEHCGIYKAYASTYSIVERATVNAVI